MVTVNWVLTISGLLGVMRPPPPGSIPDSYNVASHQYFAAPKTASRSPDLRSRPAAACLSGWGALSTGARAAAEQHGTARHGTARHSTA